MCFDGVHSFLTFAVPSLGKDCYSVLVEKMLSHVVGRMSVSRFSVPFTMFFAISSISLHLYYYVHR